MPLQTRAAAQFPADEKKDLLLGDKDEIWWIRMAAAWALGEIGAEGGTRCDPDSYLGSD